MSQENVESLRAFERAFNDRDREAMRAFLDPDAEWHVALAPVLAQSIYRGAEAVCDLLLEEIPSVMDGFRAEVLEVREAGNDAIIVEVRLVAKGRASGASIEQPFFQVYRFREGKATSLHSYVSREQALEAVGLRG